MKIIIGLIILNLILVGCSSSQEYDFGNQGDRCSKYSTFHNDVEIHVFGEVYNDENRTCCCNPQVCLCDVKLTQ